MNGIKSCQGNWSVSLCNCSRNTAHFHYGNAILHIAIEDLRELGRALEKVADGAEAPACREVSPKRGLVQ